MHPKLFESKKEFKHRLKKCVLRIWRGYKERKYSHFPPGHVFDVCVDDLQFKLAFKDYKLDLPIIERIEGHREPNTVAMIKALVKPNSKVLEIGGCYGYFTTIMALCTGPGGRVVTIEGTPNNFMILKENIERNSLKQVDCYNFFISSSGQDMRFKKNDHNPYAAIARTQDNRISKEAPAEFIVPSIRLTTFLKDIDYCPDYIFMDIEGFEVDVFEDLGEKYFNAHRPVILFEQHPIFYEGKRNLGHIVRILVEHHYIIRYDGTNVLCLPG
jgi:FkbM family methyltransferase